MAKNLDKLWTEKYRPQNVEDYLFQDHTQKLSILKMIAAQSIPNLLLSGVQGSGKTTLALMLIKELELEETDVLIINASDENSVDVIRDKLKNFVSTFAMGDYKVVLLEEADYITLNGQAVMRRMMEEFTDSVRFILTCNYEHKIMPAIRSRCQHYRFKAFDKDEIAERVVTILATEQVKFTLDLIDKYVSAGYPDIRKIINLLQQNTIDGTLQEPASTGEAGDYKFKLLDLLERDSWFEIRKLLCGNVAAEEWEDVYRFLYENLEKSAKFSNQDKWEAGIVIIADHLYKHSAIADAEINSSAMFIRLAGV
jgi:replication factor C small subunit